MSIVIEVIRMCRTAIPSGISLWHATVREPPPARPAPGHVVRAGIWRLSDDFLLHLHRGAHVHGRGQAVPRLCPANLVSRRRADALRIRVPPHAGPGHSRNDPGATHGADGAA